jgi:hypothetical protein
MASKARTEFLERKLVKEMKEHAETMKNIETELQVLRAKPRVSKDQRPRNDSVPKKVGRNEKTQKVLVKSFKKIPVDDKDTILNNDVDNNNDKTNSTAGDKTTNKMVSALFNKLQTFLV